MTLTAEGRINGLPERVGTKAETDVWEQTSAAPGRRMDCKEAKPGEGLRSVPDQAGHRKRYHDWN
jgi:hypothetical protein